VSIQNSSSIHLGHTELLLRPDSIVQMNGTDFFYTIKEIKELHQSALKLTNNKKFMMMVVSTSGSNIDGEARRFMSSPEINRDVIAKAYVVKTFSQRFVLNFIINIHGMPVPARFFNDIDEAVIWLLKQKV
jgi:hypothetical protein